MNRAWGLLAGTAVLGWILWPGVGLTHVTTTNTVVFDREIVRILNDHCVSCHVEPGPAFSLTTYEQVWLARESILRAVSTRHMPPWAAVAGYERFSNHNRLTTREMQFIVSWVEGLGPRNDGEVFLNVTDSVAPAPLQASPGTTDEWKLGPPDQTLSLRSTVPLADRERIVVEVGLDGDRRVRAVEFQPSGHGELRAVDLFLEDGGNWLGSWTPWHGFVELPSGRVQTLTAESRIVAEVRYAGSYAGTGEVGTLGLFFASPADEGALTEPDLLLQGAGDLRGSAVGVIRAEGPIGHDTVIWSLLPRFDPGIRSLEVTARRPDGGSEILLFARDIPLDWPTPYILQEPVLVPAGSRLTATAYFDGPPTSVEPRRFEVRVSRHRASAEPN